jgi:D-alanine-D-alanine ligase
MPPRCRLRWMIASNMATRCLSKVSLRAGNSRSESSVEALPVVEIVPRDGFYDYDHKYTSGASEYFVPAPLTDAESTSVQETARAAHRALGLEVYSRVDILLAPDGSMSVLEINTIPGMTELSLLPKAAAVAGLDFPSLCEEIAGLSLAKKKP